MARKSEVERLLISAGFHRVENTKHVFWTKGEYTFSTHRGSKPDKREIRRARAVVRQSEVK